MKKILLIVVMASICLSITAQKLDLNKKQLKAFRTTLPFKIDGELSELDWQNAPITTDLIINQPSPGATPSQRSEIKVVYDNTAIYIGATLFDTQPDSILKEITQRDNIGNSDWFGVFLDPYLDGINGVSFIVSA